MAKASTTSRSRAVDVALERRLERLGLIGKEEEWTDRYLLCEHLVDPPTALPRQRFEAVARFIRDLVAHRWVKTRQAREQANPKRVYYLSMEFMIGRTLNNNMMTPRRRTVAPAGDETRRLEFSRVAGRRAGRGPGERRPRPPGRLFYRLAGDPSIFGHGLWPPLRVRNFSPGDPRRLSSRGTRQVAPPSRSVGDRLAR